MFLEAYQKWFRSSTGWLIVHMYHLLWEGLNVVPPTENTGSYNDISYKLQPFNTLLRMKQLGWLLI